MKKLFSLRDEYFKKIQDVEFKLAGLNSALETKERSYSRKVSQNELDQIQARIKELEKKRDLFRFYVEKIDLFLDVKRKYEKGSIPDTVFRKELEELKKYFPDIETEIHPPISQGLELDLSTL